MLQKEKPCIKNRGVITFEQSEDVYFFRVLPKYHIFSLSAALQKLQKIDKCFQEGKLSYIYRDLRMQSFHAPVLNACFFFLEHQWVF